MIQINRKSANDKKTNVCMGSLWPDSSFHKSLLGFGIVEIRKSLLDAVEPIANIIVIIIKFLVHLHNGSF